MFKYIKINLKCIGKTRYCHGNYYNEKIYTNYLKEIGKNHFRDFNICFNDNPKTSLNKHLVKHVLNNNDNQKNNKYAPEDIVNIFHNGND